MTDKLDEVYSQFTGTDESTLQERRNFAILILETLEQAGSVRMAIAVLRHIIERPATEITPSMLRELLDASRDVISEEQATWQRFLTRVGRALGTKPKGVTVQ